MTNNNNQTQKKITDDKRTRCEIWTRVMGYHRNVSNFNVGKKSEHCSRQHFEEASSLNSAFCEKY